MTNCAIGDSCSPDNSPSLIWIVKPKKPPDPIFSHKLVAILEAEVQGDKFSKEPPANRGKEAVGDPSSMKISPKLEKKPGSWAALFKEESLRSYGESGLFAVQRMKAIQDSSSDEIFIEDDLIERSKLNWVNCLYGKFYGKTPSLRLV
ncbi:hypothetical protein Cni_G16580 [Canna indica]|uniref:Uncharacterized protein n=1 Tax=Canna indica TaxID=4628 RepID=A0AAQ3QFS7_9LILI|nr:hypothetical protein Cni_G16580 [Canna indica]